MATYGNKMSCPHCAKLLDAHSGHGDAQPKTGDFSLCWGCNKLSVFVLTPAGVMLRLPTPEEGKLVMESPQVFRALRAARETSDPLAAEELLRRYNDH